MWLKRLTATPATHDAAISQNQILEGFMTGNATSMMSQVWRMPGRPSFSAAFQTPEIVS